LITPFSAFAISPADAADADYAIIDFHYFHVVFTLRDMPLRFFFFFCHYFAAIFAIISFSLFSHYYLFHSLRHAMLRAMLSPLFSLLRHFAISHFRLLIRHADAAFA
jgi:hypothetical protein